MRKLILIALFLAACGESGAENSEGGLVTTAADGRVAVYKSHWKQGYVISSSGAVKTFSVSGSPTYVTRSPDDESAYFVDSLQGKLTVLNLKTAQSVKRDIRPNRAKITFSTDSRYALLHASSKTVATGSFDPNEMSIFDSKTKRVADLSVGSYPDAVAFYEKEGDPRVLLFSAGKMTHLRIDEIFKSLPAEDWKTTVNLTVGDNLSAVPRHLIQADGMVFLIVAGLREFVSMDLSGGGDVPTLNFESRNVSSPVWMAMGPPVAPTAETVFTHDAAKDTRFLYVLNDDKSITVFDVHNLGDPRVVDIANIGEKPDRIHATADGKRVLFYQSAKSRTLYRMNVRTGNVSAIPFEREVAEYIFSPDGASVVALHEPDEKDSRPAFTYVNFKDLFRPILLPEPVSETAVTADGRYLVFRLSSGGLRRFDLLGALMNEAPENAFDGGQALAMGPTGNPGQVYLWIDDVGGRMVFQDYEGNRTQQKVVTNFIFDKIMDR